jgi:hypothetical protein
MKMYFEKKKMEDDFNFDCSARNIARHSISILLSQN